MTQPLPEKKIDRPIIIDTSVWIDYLRGKNLPLISDVNSIIRQRLARTLNVIVAELIRGSLHQKEIKIIQQTIASIPQPIFPTDPWSDVGMFCFSLARKGLSCGLIDAYIAHTAIQNHWAIFTLDKDFDRIAKLSSLKLWKI